MDKERFFYTVEKAHGLDAGLMFIDWEQTNGAPIESLERAKELAIAAKVGKPGEMRYVETTYGVFYSTEED